MNEINVMFSRFIAIKALSELCARNKYEEKEVKVLIDNYIPMSINGLKFTKDLLKELIEKSENYLHNLYTVDGVIDTIIEIKEKV